MDKGHCGLPTDQLIPLAEGLLEAPKDLILTALELERSEGAVIADKVGDTACTFQAGLYRAEQAIADRLIRIVNGRLPWPWIDKEKAVPWVEKQRSAACRQSEGRDPAGADGEGARDHRGPRRRQDDDRQFDPQDPGRQRRATIAMRPNRPRGEAHDRSD